jgi:sugar (pentulose or hexulose) kinase
VTPYADNDDEKAMRALAIVLLTNAVFNRSFHDINDAIARMVDEALADPHGPAGTRFAADWRASSHDERAPMNRPQISAALAGLALAALSGAIVSAMVFAVAIYLAR